MRAATWPGALDEQKSAERRSSQRKQEMSQEISKADQRRNELLDKGHLTDKQAAILAAFEETPQASYETIADIATDILPEDNSVTGSYASEQIKERRPDWFDDTGRRPPEDTRTQDDKTQEDETAGTQERVEDEVETVVGEGDVAMESPVKLDEDTWLRLVAFLHLFADAEQGASHEDRLMEIAGEITSQALEQ